MNISKPTKDRITAAVFAVLVIAVILGGMLLIKSCSTYTVTYYDDIGSTNVMFTDKVGKGDKATNKTATSEGRQFDCWVTKDGEKFDFNTPIEGDLKLYAKWLE